MATSTTPEHIICLALPAWEADYLRSTVELMKCLSKENLVLYVDYAYTISDCIKAIRGKKKIEWKRMLGLKSGLRKISGDHTVGLYLLTLPPVFPSFQFSSFDFFTKANKINAIITGYAINKAAKKLGMKDIVAFNAFQPYLGRWWKIKNEQFKIFYCYDDITEMPYFKGFVAESEKQFIAQSDLLIVTSDVLKSRKQVNNIPAEIVYNGVHFNSFFQHAKPINTITNKPKTVGYTGSIDSRIDIDLLEPVVKQMPHVNFSFAGKIFDKEIFNRLSVYSNVTFIPPVPTHEVPALMSDMQLGIIPYKINSLTTAIYPLKVNEYLAMGLPVVMTPFASIGEADEVIYCAATSEDFVHCIQEALDQNNASLQQNRITIAQKADWATRADQLLEIIKSYKAKKAALAA